MKPGLDALKHIVVLMMCNRSFDHMLGGLRQSDPRIDGLRGDETNPDPSGTLVPVQPFAAYQGQLDPDPDHHFAAVDQQIFASGTSKSRRPTMQGFINSYFRQRRDLKHSHNVMYYFAPDKLPVLTRLAKEFAVFNGWFSSVPGPGLCNRAFAHYGTSFGSVTNDVHFSSQNFPSIYERLLAGGRTARIYYYDAASSTLTVPSLLSQQQLFGEYDQFLAACKNGTLPDYSFVEPNYANHYGPAGLVLASDQHPDHHVQQGEQFIATIYNALRESPLWPHTALLIVYDQHGGIYDHVSPPDCHPDGFIAQSKDTQTGSPFEFDRLGVRVPAVLVSPWIPKGTVVSPLTGSDSSRDQRVFEHASIPATVTDFFLPNFDERGQRFPRERAANKFLDILSSEVMRTDAIFFSIDDVGFQSSPEGVENQPISGLIAAQVRYFKELEDRLPVAERTGIELESIRTEREAADYIQMVTSKVAPRASTPSVVQPKRRVQIGPSTHLARDRWTVEDSLGHYPYAYGIYRFLTDGGTRPPLAISIQAPWGGGKTSIMRMIQAQLDPEALRQVEKQGTSSERAKVEDVLQELDRLSSEDMHERTENEAAGSKKPGGALKPLQVPPIRGEGERRVTVWFNAWKYESTSQVWAGLADTIVQQVSERLGPVERELFWFRLQLKRLDAGKVRRVFYEQVFAYFTDTVLPWLWAYIVPPAAATVLALVAKYAGKGQLERLGWLGLILSLVGGALVAGAKGTKAKSEVSKQPAHLSLSEFVRPPDYETTLGLVHQVVNDLRKVFALIPAKYLPMVIFIDDLDRCSPNKVADVIEAINLFLAGEFPDCMFVLGIDDEMVAAALDKAHSDVIARLPAYAKSTSIGWRFMDKFVQLPFVVPPPSEEKLKDYARSLLAETKSIDMETRERATRLAESAQAPKVIAQQLAEEKGLTPAQSQGLEKEVVIIQQMDSDIKAFSDREKVISELMVNGAEEFSENPRDLKRFVNVFRFHYFLRAARERKEEPVPTLEQLSRWIIFSLKWPEAVRWLRRNHSSRAAAVDPKIQRLEKIAKESVSLQDWQTKAADVLGVRAEEKTWVLGEEVMNFFRSEAERPEAERLSASCGRGLW
jgi:phospholipase C